MNKETWLESICKKCLKANGRCICDELYIGLCVKNDKNELLEFYKKKGKRV